VRIGVAGAVLAGGNGWGNTPWVLPNCGVNKVKNVLAIVAKPKISFTIGCQWKFTTAGNFD
jgi:hypothetical protein